MSRRDKQQRRLDVLEAELRDRLLPILHGVAAGRGTGFFVASPDRAAIQALAEEIVELADSLGLTKDDLAASKVLTAFEVANDVGDDHRLGPIRLAAKLLSELDAS